MTMRQFTAAPDWVREGTGSGVPLEFQQEAQLTGEVSTPNGTRTIQVIIRSEEKPALDLEESQQYRVTIEEV